MAASGTPAGWIIPRIQDRPRLDKPPLIYWVQASAALVLSGGRIENDAIWMYRVPSVLFAAAAVFLTWRLGTAMFGRWTGLLGAIFLAVCPLLVAEAHQARSDHLLLAVTTAAMAALWRTWRRPAPGIGTALALWALVGLGMLVKGPVTPMIVGAAALCLSIARRDARWLARTRPVLGAAVVVAVVSPWLIFAARQVGMGALVDEFVDEVLVRSARSREGHWGPPGYHLALLVVLFWPGSMLTAAAVIRAFARRRRRAELFCICWIVPAWIVFELMSTKLPHYVLPLYPPLALLSARAVIAQARWIPAARRLLPRLGFGLWLLAGLALGGAAAAAAAAGWRGAWFGAGAAAAAGAASLVAIALAAAAAVLAMRFEMRRGAAISAAAALLSIAAIFGVILPRAKPIWVAPRIMDAVERADPRAERALAAASYHEDSLIFLSRGRVERIAEKASAGWMAQHPGGILIVPQARVDALGTVVTIGRVEGFNYSTGRRVDLAVVTRE